ncbi:NACHT domain-containing protein [Streptomyces sp. NPDC005953]|uniref:NACHT domain-containing protein n=1 Tax=Streptomyces sp. NPDC005953 TaxID=3156719 RepID=UPI00340AB5F5
MVASTAYVIRQLSHGGLKTGDTAGLLAVVLAVATGLVAVVALRKQSQSDIAAQVDAKIAQGWAGTLALQVTGGERYGEGGVRRQMLGGDTELVNLTYRLQPAQARSAHAPDAGQLCTDRPGGRALPEIVAYYRDTSPRRLVITGADGAGKTVLALELLLALIEDRTEADPVPVRISLSRWDTERQDLRQLLEQRLVEAYDWSPEMAAGLVFHNMVLPVLDGLDEMDPTLPDGTPAPAPPRATAVVKALDSYQEDRKAGPVILACRTAHYDALIPHAEIVDAARIAIEPVSAADARTYLAKRPRHQERWQPLIDHLDAEPQGMLAGVLSTPWKLGMTATVYHDEGDPAELLNPTDRAEVNACLLARYIPAVIRVTPNPHGYTADQVHRWLHRLTLHLEPASTGRGRPAGTDLLLYELWPLAGRLRVRSTDALLAALTVLVSLPLALTTPHRGTSALVIVGIAVITGFYIWVSTPSSPSRIDLHRLFTTEGLKDLRVALAIGLTFGLVVGLVLGSAAGPTLGIGYGLAIWLTVGLGFGLLQGSTGEPTAAATPRGVMRKDAMAGLALGLAVALAAALGTGLAFRSTAELTVPLALATGFLFTSGIMSDPEPVAGATGAARRYLIFLICSRGRLPFRLGRFLDWAASAGLLRYSGAAYQYRHREFQHWLRDHPDPPSRR